MKMPNIRKAKSIIPGWEKVEWDPTASLGPNPSVFIYAHSDNIGDYRNRIQEAMPDARVGWPIPRPNMTPLFTQDTFPDFEGTAIVLAEATPRADFQVTGFHVLAKVASIIGIERMVPIMAITEESPAHSRSAVEAHVPIGPTNTWRFCAERGIGRIGAPTKDLPEAISRGFQMLKEGRLPEVNNLT